MKQIRWAFDETDKVGIKKQIRWAFDETDKVGI